MAFGFGVSVGESSTPERLWDWTQATLRLFRDTGTGRTPLFVSFFTLWTTGTVLRVSGHLGSDFLSAC